MAVSPVAYDADVDAMYVELHEGIVDRTRRIETGVLLDLSEDGRVLGLEVLAARHRAWMSDDLIYEVGEEHREFLTSLQEARWGNDPKLVSC